jgi:ribosome recycling factor
MNGKQILKDAEDRMEKALQFLRDELRGLRTGRATPALVENIRVDYYGSPTPLKHLAQITTPDAQSILIRPHDQAALKDMEKAVRSSDLGLTPNSDGKLIRLQVPAMSGDQRKKIVQNIKKMAEDAKVSCRSIRRDGNKQFEQEEKNKTMGEDEADRGKEDVQNLLKKYEDRITEVADKKAKEVMEQ